MSSGAGSSGSVIREVWGPNLEQEMAGIRDIIFEYPYISMARSSPARSRRRPPPPPPAALAAATAANRPVAAARRSICAAAAAPPCRRRAPRARPPRDRTAERAHNDCGRTPSSQAWSPSRSQTSSRPPTTTTRPPEARLSSRSPSLRRHAWTCRARARSSPPAPPPPPLARPSPHLLQTIRTNAELLKLIQLGLTLSNERGEI